MKLRIRGNSLRLRLQRAEVQNLADHGRVEESIGFPQGCGLAYSLEVADEARAVSVSFEDAAIRVRLPPGLARRWALSDEVGIDAALDLPNNETLHLLIEKDFACLKPRSSGVPEDESDAFPNPNPSCGQPA